MGVADGVKGVADGVKGEEKAHIAGVVDSMCQQVRERVNPE